MNKNQEKEIVALVRADFENRQSARRSLEAQWQLNENFLAGNQYCMATGSGEIVPLYRDYFWQHREVFNHIAPLVEARLSKLNSIRPKMSVRPASSDSDDTKTASIASKILNSACNKLNIDGVLQKGVQWSEVVGSVFYKITWDAKSGRIVGKRGNQPIFEGDVRIDVCPPYEIYPDSLLCTQIEECGSIIHAKAVSVAEIERIYGVLVAEENVLTLNSRGYDELNKGGYALVIERYTTPTAQNPQGELVIVASDRLLYCGSLPFRCGEDNTYALPFIKQDSLTSPSCFYGTSVIERCIPIQRAFNAVKNRKHEFMNRIAMGVLAVEDGSIDTDNLESEGLSPGKILVYRQGAPMPKLLDTGSIPAEFNLEEDKLIEEFVSVSGVSGLLRSSSVPSSISSATGLQLLLDQDDNRLSHTAQNVKNASKQIGKFILRLYKQFARSPRLNRFVGADGEIELISWHQSHLTSDDIVIDADGVNESATARKNAVVEALKLGLLQDENGKLSDSMRIKIMDMLGLSSWEVKCSSERLHVLRASRENTQIAVCVPVVKPIDDHKLHIDEHTNYALGGEFLRLCEGNPELEEVMFNHILEHKVALSASNKGNLTNLDSDSDLDLDSDLDNSTKSDSDLDNSTKSDSDKSTDLDLDSDLDNSTDSDSDKSTDLDVDNSTDSDKSIEIDKDTAKTQNNPKKGKNNPNNNQINPKNETKKEN